MSRYRLAASAAALAAVMQLWPTSAGAQGYRLRLDSRFQLASFRGVALDSVSVADTVTGSTGGPESPDGFAVRCRSGISFCTFFRPGPERRGGPLVSTADLRMWGFGIPGLSVRTTTRLGVDVGDAGRWPGTDPAVQLVEGYAEYAYRDLRVVAGRTHVANRFGYVGFDGGKADVRLFDQRVRASVYGGFGLARGVALPVTSSALNPLDDFQPRQRQVLLGGSIGWSSPLVRARIHYQREVDTRTDKFVSERIGADASIRPLSSLRVTGGVDYDLAFGWLGNAELAATYTMPRRLFAVTVGGRRYRPHFDLWTIWGAFSPVPYHSLYGVARVSPLAGVELRSRLEGYRFEDAEADTPLANAEDDGWRWSLGATYARSDWWSAEVGYHVERGVGAASIGVDGAVTASPRDDLSVTARVTRLERPLEFRFDEANVWAYGVRARYRPADAVSVSFGLRQYDETRERPDAARFDWDQLRVEAGVTLFLGSGADTPIRDLHPAILRIPPRGGSR